MATRGRPHSPLNARFNSVPHFRHGAIYAVEFTNGVVKVGQSRMPRVRLVTLRQEAERDRACELVRFFVGPDLGEPSSLYWAEVDLLKRMGACAQPLSGCREYFRGIDFDVAQAFVAEVSAKYVQGRRRSIKRADERADSLMAHGSSICPAEPLNTTQQIGVAR